MLAIGRWPDLAADYRHAAAVMRVNAANWQSGMAPGRTMMFVATGSLRVVGGGTFPTPHVLTFFDKAGLDALPRLP